LAVVIIEKFVESFTLTLMLGRIPNPIVFWLMVTFYAISTPLTILIVGWCKLKDRVVLTGVFMSISAGVFIFIGLLLWRKTFLTPFDWKKSEIVLVCVVFILGTGIQALTRLAEPLGIM
jgi:hypothetical protein